MTNIYQSILNKLHLFNAVQAEYIAVGSSFRVSEFQSFRAGENDGDDTLNALNGQENERKAQG